MIPSKERTIRLIKHGFVKSSARDKYKWDDNQGIFVPKEGDYDPEDAKEEYQEEASVLPGFMGEVEYAATGYPESPKTFRITYKSPSASLEESYYYLLDEMRTDWGFPYFKKITDVFSASEQSAFWGQAQQRIGMQQDKATQYMATIGKMVKDLFQLVRELRIIEERKEIYEKAPKSKSADVTLKGMFIDMVEGGSKNPSSVYGIAQQVGFTTLPDVFFNTHIYDLDSIDETVANMKWNKQVKNILKRKLFSFLNWKDKTEKELNNRFKFTLRYLRQHWGTIKMYMNWVKPYLKNVERMKMSEKHMDDEKLIGAFETSITEIEVIAMKAKQKNGVRPCVLISMKYVTQPEMNYRQEGYQHRGPLHVGEVEFHMRAYGWTEQEIEQFSRLKRDEDMELIKLIDESVASAMDALGDDLKKYLEKADEELEEEKDEELERPKGTNPFTALAGGFMDLFKMFGSRKPVDESEEKTALSIPDYDKMNEIAMSGNLDVAMYQTYKNYKKAHGMLSW